MTTCGYNDDGARVWTQTNCSINVSVDETGKVSSQKDFLAAPSVRLSVCLYVYVCARTTLEHGFRGVARRCISTSLVKCIHVLAEGYGTLMYRKGKPGLISLVFLQEKVAQRTLGSCCCDIRPTSMLADFTYSDCDSAASGVEHSRQVL